MTTIPTSIGWGFLLIKGNALVHKFLLKNCNILSCALIPQECGISQISVSNLLSAP